MHAHLTLALIGGFWPYITPPPHGSGRATGDSPLILLGAIVYKLSLGLTPGAFAFMAIGFNSSILGAFPLPVSLDYFGMPGCWIYHDTAHTLLSFCTAPSGGFHDGELRGLPEVVPDLVEVPSDDGAEQALGKLNHWAFSRRYGPDAPQLRHLTA